MSATDDSGRLENETLKAIESRLGRPLRVLHIGNIANNAYNNARIQRQYGIEAEVLSYNYHHVMSCPEWEDAEFTGEVDPDAPNWWATSLKGWKRPDWFVQGPTESCLQYLRARHLGLHDLQKLLWRYLEARCLGHVQDVAQKKGEPVPPMPPHLKSAIEMTELLGVEKGPGFPFPPDVREQFRAILPSLGRVDPPSHPMGQAAIEPGSGSTQAPEAVPSAHAVAGAADSPDPEAMLPGQDAPRSESVFRRASQGARRSYQWLLETHVFPELKSESPRGILARLWLWQKSRRLGGASREEILALVAETGTGRERLLALRQRKFHLLSSRRMQRFPGQEPRLASQRRWINAERQRQQLLTYFETVDTSSRDEQAIARLMAAAGHFKNVPESVSPHFVEYFADFYTQFYDILDKYDVIQCYSIDGCICWSNGFDRFISYEHGTLRDLPFGQDFYGVVTRIAYHASTYVFVTNSDVLPATRRMGLDPARVICLPHAFDDRKLMAFRMQNPNLRPLPGPPVIFSPTRQHWKDKSGSWTKGNDILFRAAAILAAEGQDFRLHLVEWGQEIEDSKALIAELGIADKVVWLQPMKKRELWECYCWAHAVADQFTLPALGGVGFETMALARRLITAIDVEQLTQFFGEAPPCLNASTVEECAARLRLVFTDVEDEAGHGLAAQRWMRQYHSAERIVAIQAETYADFLEKNAYKHREDHQDDYQETAEIKKHMN